MKYLFALLLLVSACTTTSSSRALSPDREPAAPRRHLVPPDSAATAE